MEKIDKSKWLLVACSTKGCREIYRTPGVKMVYICPRCLSKQAQRVKDSSRVQTLGK